MRIFILLLFTLIFNVCLYAQDTNADNNIATNNTISTNNIGESAIMRINRFDAKRNPVSFINLVNFTPYYVLQEYAKINNIEIYPYDTEASLRARIIERQVNIKQEVIKGNEEVREIARTTINRGGAQVELIGADFAERYAVEEAEEELISLYGNVTMKMYNNTLIADKVVYSLKTGEVFASGNITVKAEGSTLNGEWFMITLESLKEDFRNIGIKAGDTLFLRISYKAVGKVEGGPIVFLKALHEVVGEEGTIILTAFPDLHIKQYYYFHKKKVTSKQSPAKPHTGIMSVMALTYPKSCLSRKLEFPFVVIGKHAEYLTSSHTHDMPPYWLLEEAIDKFDCKLVSLLQFQHSHLLLLMFRLST